MRTDYGKRMTVTVKGTVICDVIVSNLDGGGVNGTLALRLGL